MNVIWLQFFMESMTTDEGDFVSSFDELLEYGLKWSEVASRWQGPYYQNSTACAGRREWAEERNTREYERTNPEKLHSPYTRAETIRENSNEETTIRRRPITVDDWQWSRAMWYKVLYRSIRKWIETRGRQRRKLLPTISHLFCRENYGHSSYMF